MPTIWALARLRQAELLPPEARPRTRKSLARFLREDAPTFEAFCGCVKVISKDGFLVPFVLNRVQRRRHAAWTRRDVLLKARQQGLTTYELVRDLWHFLTRPNANVVVLCQSGKDHMALDEVTSRFERIVRSLEEHVVIPWRGRPSSTYLELLSGAIMKIGEAGASQGAASKTGRAGSVSRLHATELAYWEYAGETWNAILECIPEGGDSEIVIESTANGSAPDVARGERDLKRAAGPALLYWLYQDAKAEQNGFAAHFFPWWETEDYSAAIPDHELPFHLEEGEETWLRAQGLTPAQLQWRRVKLRKKDGDTFSQEYPKDDVTCFLFSGRPFFDKAQTARLALGCTEPLRRVAIRGSGARGEIRFWAYAQPGFTYVIASDTSEGTGGDPCAAHVYERGTARLMATLDGQLKPVVLAKWLAWLGQAFGWAAVAVERNNHGHAVLLALHEIEKYRRIFTDWDGKQGWNTNAVTRTPALDKLEEAHRTGVWETRDIVVVGEFRTFVVNDKGRAEASRGAHDEHPLCAAIGLDILTRPGVARGVGKTPLLPY